MEMLSKESSNGRRMEGKEDRNTATQRKQSTRNLKFRIQTEDEHPLCLSVNSSIYQHVFPSVYTSSIPYLLDGVNVEGVTQFVYKDKYPLLHLLHTNLSD